MSRKPISVLLIEDNPADARLISELLKEEVSAEIELTRATDLKCGLDHLARGEFDAVLLDLSLPDSQGIETFNHVNSHASGVPIVVLTGLNDDKVAAQTLRAGGQDFLVKGAINFCILNQTLRHAMERKQAEGLSCINHAIEVANRAHNHFLAVLGSELKKPMASVLATVSAVSSELTTRADLSPTLSMIRCYVEAQGRLIDDVLKFSRVETQDAVIKSTDCEAVFQSALVDLKSSIEQACAVITHDSLPTFYADGTQLQQLFQALIGNALKFRGESSPRIHVAAKRQGEEWVFSIRDNGIGFDPANAERIFTIFQRLHDNGKYPGSGLGLAICKKIVARHGGHIWAESEPGKGSTFTFTLPAKEDGET